MLAAMRVLNVHRAFMEMAEAKRSEVDIPLPVVELEQTDPFAAERLTHIDSGAVPADAAKYIPSADTRPTRARSGYLVCMGCSRGKASPNEVTKLRLFANSAGFCQKPDCSRPLFVDAGGTQIHIAEMAHIFAAKDDGPRANSELSEEQRGAFENLILLCPTCHTTIDKAPRMFGDTIIAEWKRRHSAKVASIFGVAAYGRRSELRAAVNPVLTENRVIFEEYGPNKDYRFDPESEVAFAWQRKVRSTILPNNRKLLAMLDANRGLLLPEEGNVVERFRQHVDDFEARHLGGTHVATAARFPVAMNSILIGDEHKR